MTNFHFYHMSVSIACFRCQMTSMALSQPYPREKQPVVVMCLIVVPVIRGGGGGLGLCLKCSLAFADMNVVVTYINAAIILYLLIFKAIFIIIQISGGRFILS